MTNAEMVRDSLGLIGVLAEVQAASTEQSLHGIRTLNDLMSDWEQDGVDLQYFEQTNPGDETPIPAHARAAVKHFLAFALAPFYGKSVTPELAAIGDKFYSRLVRDAVIERLPEIQRLPLPLAEGLSTRSLSILTDEPINP
jgi:hypothetical protein